MTGTAGIDMSLDGLAQQVEVSDQVEQLVAGRLVREPQVNVVQDAVFRHFQVAFVEKCAQLGKDFRRGHLRHKDDGVVQIAAADEVVLDEEL